MKVPFPTERTMEDYICEHLDADGYCPITDQRYTHHFRQLQIAGYGVADLVLVDADPTAATITVVELKNTELCAANLEQLGRYMTGLQRLSQLIENDELVNGEVFVQGVLAGPFNPQSSELVWLYHQTENIEIYSVSIDVENGFDSEPIGKGWFKKSEELGSMDQLVVACNDSIRMQRDIWDAMERASTMGGEDA